MAAPGLVRAKAGIAVGEMVPAMVTQGRLKELFLYDHDTGFFTRRIHAAANARAGDIAGSINPKGYLQIDIDGTTYLAHRLAWLYMTGEWPAKQIDHRNGVRSENWWDNLRPASNQQNQANRKIGADNSSGFKGVSFHRGMQKWQAYIIVDNRKRHLGYFADPEVAHGAYFSAAQSAFGEFARAG